MKIIDGGLLICQIQCSDKELNSMGIDNTHWAQGTLDLSAVNVIIEHTSENHSYAVFHFTQYDYVITDLTYAQAVEAFQAYKLGVLTLDIG